MVHESFFGWFDGNDNGSEHNGVGIVEISTKFAMQGALFFFGVE